AFEEAQGEEPPLAPREVPQFTEVVEPRVVEREGLRLQRSPLVPDLAPEREHTFLDRVDRELAAVDGDPSPTELLRHCTRRTRTGERIENDVAGLRRRRDDSLDNAFRLLRR